MFIELTEVLRCPNPHEEAYVVCAPIEMRGRDVVRGVVGCPVCQAEFPIVAGVADFGGQAVGRSGGQDDGPAYDASALEAFLSVEGKGGYVVLAGRTARHAAELAQRMTGVHLVAVNPPPGLTSGEKVSVLCAAGIPLKTQHARAVALGADTATPAWLAEAERVLLPGLRLLVESDGAALDRITVLAQAGGVLVGEKRAR